MRELMEKAIATGVAQPPPTLAPKLKAAPWAHR
jgi:hypothetical protein